MGLREICLNGEWSLAGFAPGSDEASARLSGTVPGQVHVDLLREGLIPDPFLRDQAEQCQWVESWDWEYSREFVVPEGFKTGWEVIEFEGLDTFATVWLNGQEVGHTDNMFVPHRFEVGPLLRAGANTLTVRFTSPSKALEGKPIGKYVSLFSEERIFARKMQCGFGWDWVHRFVTAGIWRPVRLVAYDRARIEDVFVYTRSLEPRRASLHFEFSAEVRSAEGLVAEATIRDPQGNIGFTRKVPVAAGKTSFEVGVDDPQLWWPNGYGEQPLYRCEVVLSRDRVEVDRRETAFGIRTIEIEQIPDAIGSSFTIVVNGKRIFARGGNWVPADPFPARVTRERYEHLIQLAREGNANMMRSWGGGIYEPEAFWEACDKAGILIMQDFLLACAWYPEDDPEFLEALRVEFGEAIRLLRNHPSLAMWSGDNELGMNSDAKSDYNGRKIAEAVSGPLCAELDPSRPYMPTSPYGGNPNNCTTEGDCHASSWYDPAFHATDMREYRKAIDTCWGRFLSESVTVGMPPLRSVRKWASEADLRDPSARILEYHNKDNPYNGIEHATHYQLLKATAEKLYGASADPEEIVPRMEYEQYEWVRLSCEALRRRKWDCSGVLFWMYNDCWPANGCSLVDYYGFPKAGWYAMKSGFKPLICAIEPGDTELPIWLCNDTFEAIDCEVRVRFQPWTGAPRWERRIDATVPGNASARVGTIAIEEVGSDGVLVCDVAGGEHADRAWHFRGMPLEMDLPKANLRVEQAGNTVTVSTDVYARVVALDADLVFSDNYFDLLPGEKRVVTWACPEGEYRGRVAVGCWNG